MGIFCARIGRKGLVAVWFYVLEFLRGSLTREYSGLYFVDGGNVGVLRVTVGPMFLQVVGGVRIRFREVSMVVAFYASFGGFAVWNVCRQGVFSLQIASGGIVIYGRRGVRGFSFHYGALAKAEDARGRTIEYFRSFPVRRGRVI